MRPRRGSYGTNDWVCGERSRSSETIGPYRALAPCGELACHRSNRVCRSIRDLYAPYSLRANGFGMGTHHGRRSRPPCDARCPLGDRPCSPRIHRKSWRMSVRALLVAAIIMPPIAAEAQTAGAPLELEAKIPLGPVRGRIDHLAVDLKRQLLFVAQREDDTI